MKIQTEYYNHDFCFEQLNIHDKMAELVIVDNEYLMRKIARNPQNFKERKFNEDRRTYKDVHTSGTILIIMSSLFLI